MKNVIKPQGCTNLKLRQVDRMVTRHYDRYVAEVGLKNTQYALLSHVVKLGPIPDGHPKLLHLWPVKLLQAGRGDCRSFLFF